MMYGDESDHGDGLWVMAYVDEVQLTGDGLWVTLMLMKISLMARLVVIAFVSRCWRLSWMWLSQ